MDKKEGKIMKIGIASDHRGVELKKEIIHYLEEQGHEVVNYGTNTTDSVDYPDYAFRLCDAVLDGTVERGIVICYTGIGMCMACNKVEGIRCAKVENREEATMTRLHNDANVMALRATMPEKTMKEIVDAFINTPFSNEERHLKRIAKLESHHAH